MEFRSPQGTLDLPLLPTFSGQRPGFISNLRIPLGRLFRQPLDFRQIPSFSPSMQLRHGCQGQPVSIHFLCGMRRADLFLRRMLFSPHRTFSGKASPYLGKSPPARTRNSYTMEQHTIQTCVRHGTWFHLSSQLGIIFSSCPVAPWPS